MTPEKRHSDGEGCAVCNREVKSNRRRMNLDASEYEADPEDYTIRSRLEQILEDSLPESASDWMCDLCFKELTQIEEYYELLRRFKSKYLNTRTTIENAEKNKTNVLMNSVQNVAHEAKGDEDDDSMIQLHLPYLSALSKDSNDQEILIKTEIEEDEHHDTSFDTSSEFPDHPLLTITRDSLEGTLKKPIKCVICAESGDAAYMRKHMSDFHSNELHPLACKTCGKNFRSKKKLLRHSALHNGRRPYKCPMCPKDFNSTDHLKRHLKTHSSTLPFNCCDKVLGTNEEVAAHMLEHKKANKERYKCTDCEGIFNTKREFTTHLKTAHSDRYEEMKSELEVTCIVCNKSFANQSKLTRHMQAHSDIAPFSCDLCDKSFKREQTLLEHKRVHSGEKPYQCSMCEKSYLAKASLQSHERTHTGEKQCLCPICGKGFHENSYLTRHMTIHSEEKKYKCPVCGKGFKRADHVTKHMPIHTGIKPYLCNICGTAFARLDKLKQHMHKHNRPDKPKPERKPKVPKIKEDGPEGAKPKKPRIRKPKKPKTVSDGSAGPTVPKTEVENPPPATPENPSMDAQNCPPVIVEPPHHSLEPHSSLASALSSAQFITASQIGLMAIGAQYGTYAYGMDDESDGKYMNIPQVDMHHHHHHHPEPPYNKHLGHH